MKDTFLSKEVYNRFVALPPAQKTMATMIRLTVEVTRELLEDCPESVDEYLRVCKAQARGIN